MSSNKLTGINLNKSFEKFKGEIGDHPATTRLIIGLKKAYDKILVQNGENYAQGFGLLAGAVKAFIVSTTEVSIYDIDKMLATGEQGEAQNELTGKIDEYLNTH